MFSCVYTYVTNHCKIKNISNTLEDFFVSPPSQ